MRRNAPALATQLRLQLAPACDWHRHAGAPGAPPCERDGQLRVTDCVRGRQAVCCAPHGLTLVALWRATVPNRRRNAGRITLAWLPDARRRVLLPSSVIGAWCGRGAADRRLIARPRR